MMDDNERIDFYNEIPSFMRHAPHMYFIQQDMMRQQNEIREKNSVMYTRSVIQTSEPGGGGGGAAACGGEKVGQVAAGCSD